MGKKNSTMNDVGPSNSKDPDINGTVEDQLCADWPSWYVPKGSKKTMKP